MNRPEALVLGLPLADLTMEDTLAVIARLVEDGRRTGRTHQVATVNVDFLVNAHRDERLRRILQAADVNLVDGMPVVWATRWLGVGVRERVAGVDVVERLVDASRRTGHRVLVFGSTPDVADRARALFADRYPGALVTIDPGPARVDPDRVDEAVIGSIRSQEPDILLVALGNPKQERFIEANREVLGVPVMIGVGGSLDMLTGHRKRAPEWIQRIGAEWVVRAYQEPARLGRRYARDIRVFGPAIARAWIGSRRRRNGLGLSLSAHPETVVASLERSVDTDGTGWGVAADAVCAGRPLVIDLEPGHPVRDVAAAQVVSLLRLARRHRTMTSWRADRADVVAAFGPTGVTAEMLGLAADD